MIVQLGRWKDMTTFWISATQNATRNPSRLQFWSWSVVLWALNWPKERAVELPDFL